ncbi:hypothetical protein [Desulfonatronospira sp. MSAO_Bac3]|uniref:hypothetical protein n=1 Tax=Desulfonatronospira sp. MSAO_Bac3 TaxID=2293857 RepID=UPI00257A0EB2|nr:hypothetical protein [Desulfonatronospira sp. MSAO_Bac3]
MYIPLHSKAVLASEPVDTTLVGCVVERSFYSLGHPLFEHDLNRAEEIYKGLVSDTPGLGDVYQIYPHIDKSPYELLDLSDYEGKSLGIKGSLLPGDTFFVSGADSVTVLQDACHENLLDVITQKMELVSSALSTDAGADEPTDISHSGQGRAAPSFETDLPPELLPLAEQDALTVRALRGWGMLPEKFDSLILAFQHLDSDLLGADHRQIRVLSQEARQDSQLEQWADPLEQLAESMALITREVQ